jgi:hypothetical protein
MLLQRYRELALSEPRYCGGLLYSNSDCSSLISTSMASIVVLGGIIFSVIATETKVDVFKPGRGDAF